MEARYFRNSPYFCTSPLVSSVWGIGISMASLCFLVFWVFVKGLEFGELEQWGRGILPLSKLICVADVPTLDPAPTFPARGHHDTPLGPRNHGARNSLNYFRRQSDALTRILPARAVSLFVPSLPGKAILVELESDAISTNTDT